VLPAPVVQCVLDYSAEHATDDITSEISCGKTTKHLGHPSQAQAWPHLSSFLSLSLSTHRVLQKEKRKEKILLLLICEDNNISNPVEFYAAVKSGQPLTRWQ
jgi:hypothetical protein